MIVRCAAPGVLGEGRGGGCTKADRLRFSQSVVARDGPGSYNLRKVSGYSASLRAAVHIFYTSVENRDWISS